LSRHGAKPREGLTVVSLLLLLLLLLLLPALREATGAHVPEQVCAQNR
jgi:hypothetical protein